LGSRTLASRRVGCFVQVGKNNQDTKRLPNFEKIPLNEKILNSKLVVIKETGHRFNYEKPEEVNDIIWNFIKEYIK